jgi:hypothetical protein
MKLHKYRKNLQLKNGMEAVFERRKPAAFARARDRSGILFCRRQKRYKRIARFFAEQKMRPNPKK